MFKRVGKEIKTWAKVLVILQMIPVVILGLSACFGGFFLSDILYEDLYIVVGIVVGVLILVVGYFIARLTAILLYAKGEAVDRLMRIDERLERMERHHPGESGPHFVPGGFAPPAPRPAPQPNPVNSVPVSVPTADPVVEQEPVDLNRTVDAAPVAPVAAPADWACSVCGYRNPADGNWCRNCGTKRSL